MTPESLPNPEQHDAIYEGHEQSVAWHIARLRQNGGASCKLAL